MSAAPARTWLAEATWATRELTLGSFTQANTCILSTRILLRVLDRNGISARPLPVRAAAFNEHAARLYASGIPMTRWPAEAWSVVVGGFSEVGPEGGWDGHLVVIARSTPERGLGAPRVLVDPTADQMARPRRGVHVGGPIIFGISPEQSFIPRDPLGTVNGDSGVDLTSVLYWPMPPGDPVAKRYRTAPDWTGKDDLIEAAAVAVEERIAGSGPIQRGFRVSGG